jgi:hypothetical protein
VCVCMGPHVPTTATSLRQIPIAPAGTPRPDALSIIHHLREQGGAIANVIASAMLRHPAAPRPLQDWSMVLIMEPTTVRCDEHSTLICTSYMPLTAPAFAS